MCLMLQLLALQCRLSVVSRKDNETCMMWMHICVLACTMLWVIVCHTPCKSLTKLTTTEHSIVLHGKILQKLTLQFAQQRATDVTL